MNIILNKSIARKYSNKIKWYEATTNMGIKMDDVKSNPDLPWFYRALMMNDNFNMNVARHFKSTFTNWKDIVDKISCKEFMNLIEFHPELAADIPVWLRFILNREDSNKHRELYELYKHRLPPTIERTLYFRYGIDLETCINNNMTSLLSGDERIHYSDERITLEILEKYFQYSIWDWENLFRHTSLPFDMFKKYGRDWVNRFAGRVDILSTAKNISMTIWFIRQNIEIWNERAWCLLSENGGIHMTDIDENMDLLWQWDHVSANPNLTYMMMSKHRNKLWCAISISLNEFNFNNDKYNGLIKGYIYRYMNENYIFYTDIQKEILKFF